MGRWLQNITFGTKMKNIELFHNDISLISLKTKHMWFQRVKDTLKIPLQKL